MSSEQLPVNNEESLQSSGLSPQESVDDLKQINTQQAEEIERLKGEVEAFKTPSSLRGTPPSQGESLDVPKLEASATLKTQGVKPSRPGGISILQSAAKKAARSNSRTDVHEYMRLRRNYV